VTAIILRFPIRESIRVVREHGGEGWLVITHRSHAWLHGDFSAALHDAREIASGFGVSVRSTSAGRIPC
jgi:hypothetical protein